jgi:hypothetical protein
MNHREIQKLIGAYVDGELHGEEKRIVEEHIKTCADCARELEYIRELNEKIKGEKMPLPADAYWETFPKRVMERAKEHHERSFFAVWVPRMKWELAAGMVLLLLTFVVSRQVLMKRSVEEIAIRGGRHAVTTEKSASEGGYVTKDGAGVLDSPVSGRVLDETAKKEKLAEGSRDIAGEEEGFVAGKKADVIEAPKSVATITKGADVDDKEVREEEPFLPGESAKAGGLNEVEVAEVNKAAISLEKKKEPAGKTEEIELAADMAEDSEEHDEGLRFAQTSERSQQARRGLLRLLYDEADRTRKKTDIERAMREIEFYQYSYPEDFQDTLLIFIDSLQQMIEEVERQESETPAAENGTE